MSQYMTVVPKVWPVAADPEGLWLLSGSGPWEPAEPVGADSTVHAEIELVLGMNGVDLAAVQLLHSTSWMQEGPRTILTYVAVVEPSSGFVRRTWPTAVPISPLLPAAVGKPLTHAPTAPPTIRHVDVLMHGLRHLAFLRMYDGTSAVALDGNPLWREHLRPLKPALAGLFNQEHPQAA